ncbi:MAG: hypothetical protein GXZ11_01600 [Tissierellia bacterium]|nr:hypothetical protein [Tissierellia bacterium]
MKYLIFILWIIGIVIIRQFKDIQYTEISNNERVVNFFLTISLINIFIFNIGQWNTIIWLLLLSFEDLLYMEISIEYIFSLAVTTIYNTGTLYIKQAALLIAIWALFSLLHKYNKSVLGDGDIDIIVIILNSLPFFQWILYIQMLSLCILVVLLPMIFSKRVSKKDIVPMVPFLAVAFILTNLIK